MLLYKITNKVNGQAYIGATKRTSLRTRMTEHCCRAMRGSTLPLSRAIREYGWQNFDVAVIGTSSTVDELMQMERAAITLHKTLHPRGYNIAAGGEGVAPTAKARGSSWNKGIPHSDATKFKMSRARTGALNPRAREVEYRGERYASVKDAAIATGLSRSQIHGRLKAGLATYLTPPHAGPWSEINRGRTASTEARAKMSVARKGSNNWNARRIQFEGREYSSISDAMAATGLSRMQMKTRLKNGVAHYLTAKPRMT